MVTGEEILAIAAREIGYCRDKSGHNTFGEWFGLDYQPYCMEFVQWVYHQAGLDLPYKTASCGALLRWYKEHQPECVTGNPIPGCIVIFDFPSTAYDTDHTGLFVKVSDNKITTIDGNTSGGNDSNGGWVQQRTRKLSYANPTYIIPKGLTDMDINKLIDEMTSEQAYRIFLKANEHAALREAPNWMKDELATAVEAGITDGARPRAACTRGEAAIMVLRGRK